MPLPPWRPTLARQRPEARGYAPALGLLEVLEEGELLGLQHEQSAVQEAMEELRCEAADLDE